MKMHPGRSEVSPASQQLPCLSPTGTWGSPTRMQPTGVCLETHTKIQINFWRIMIWSEDTITATVSIIKNLQKLGRITAESNKLKFQVCRVGRRASQAMAVFLPQLKGLLIRFILVECPLILRMWELCWLGTMVVLPKEIPINLKPILWIIQTECNSWAGPSFQRPPRIISPNSTLTAEVWEVRVVSWMLWVLLRISKIIASDKKDTWEFKEAMLEILALI